MKFKKLSESKVVLLIAEMEKAAEDGPKTWALWHSEHIGKEAMIEFPLGELFCGGIQGYLIAWRMQNRIGTAQLEKDDRFNAQGIEGKCQVVTTLVTALLAYRELPKYRRQLRIAK